MNTKKLFLISFIATLLLFVVAIIGVYFYILNNGNSGQMNDLEEAFSNNEDSDSLNDVNLVDFIEIPDKEFRMALVYSDDSIQLVDDDNEFFPITFDDNNWSDVMWSPDNKYLSAISNGNIHIFDMSEKTWTQYTVYEGFGVDSYVWIDEFNIFYFQGIAPDRWVHKLDIRSGEIQKITRVDATFVDISPSRQYLLVLSNLSQIQVLDLNGNFIWNSSDSFTLEEDISLSTVEFGSGIFVGTGEGKFLLSGERDGKNVIYKTSIEDKYVVEIARDYKFLPICSMNSDELLVINADYLEEGSIYIINFDAKTTDDRLIAKYDLDSSQVILQDSFYCDVDKDILFFAVKMEDEGFSKVDWYVFSGESFEKLDPSLYINVKSIVYSN